MTTDIIKSKLLREFQFLKADKITIENAEDQLHVYFLKADRKIKKFKFKSSNADELNALLKDKDFSPNGSTGAQEKPKVKHTRAAPVILVVEDDPDQREILSIMLRDLKYEVCLAQNGEEALTLAADKAPDLIITDLMMPKMDGTEFIKKIKRNPAYQNIPVLVLTVLSDPDKEYSLLNLGVDDYCQKTMPRKILNKRIENLVNRHLQAP